VILSLVEGVEVREQRELMELFSLRVVAETDVFLVFLEIACTMEVEVGQEKEFVSVLLKTLVVSVEAVMG
jgi:hypothetical protein